MPYSHTHIDAVCRAKAKITASKNGQIIDPGMIGGKFLNACTTGNIVVVRSLMPAIIAEQSYKVAVKGIRLACKNRNFKIAKYILKHAIPSPHLLFDIEGESADFNNEWVRNMSASVDMIQWFINHFSLTMDHFVHYEIDTRLIQSIGDYPWGSHRTHDFQRPASDLDLLTEIINDMKVSPRDNESLWYLAHHFVAKSKSNFKEEFEIWANRVITLRASLQNRTQVRPNGGESGVSRISIDEHNRRLEESKRFRIALKRACLFGDEELVFWLMQEVKFFPEMQEDCLDGLRTACAEYNFSMMKDIIIYGRFKEIDLFCVDNIKWSRNIAKSHEMWQWLVDRFDLTPERFEMYIHRWIRADKWNRIDDSVPFVGWDRAVELNQADECKRVVKPKLLLEDPQWCAALEKEALAGYNLARAAAELKYETALVEEKSGKRTVPEGGARLAKPVGELSEAEFSLRMIEQARFEAHFLRACTSNDLRMVFLMTEELKASPELSSEWYNGFYKACENQYFSVVKAVIVHAGLTEKDLFGRVGRSGELKWLRDIATDRDMLQWLVDHFNLTPEHFERHKIDPELIQDINFPK